MFYLALSIWSIAAVSTATKLFPKSIWKVFALYGKESRY
jgi:hypothetical protein